MDHQISSSLYTASPSLLFDSPSILPSALVSYPPLNQVTVVREKNVKFSVLLDVPAAEAAAGSWQVAVWLSLGGEWKDLNLSPVTDQEKSVVTSFKPASPSADIVVFEGQAEVSNTCLFTVKFRHGNSSPWQWVRDQWGTENGTIIFNSAKSPEDCPGNLPLLIKNLDPVWHWSSVGSQTPKTSVWTLTAPIGCGSGSSPVDKEFRLGVPFGGYYLRWFAIVRISRPWMLPRQGRHTFELDRPAILASFLGPDGRHMILLAVSGTNDVMTLLKHGPEGAVMAHARNDGTYTQSATVIAATGHEFRSAVAAAMYQARSMVMACKAMEEDRAKEITVLGKVATTDSMRSTTQDDNVEAKWVENWYDGLGYCTWNAFGRGVTDEKVFGALDRLAESNVHISNLIIDDNWQSIEYAKEGPYHFGWLEFEAEKESFPQGLKKTVDHIRRHHPGIKRIAVWHALLGYWGGVSPHGKIASQYKTQVLEREHELQDGIPIGGPIDVIAKPDVYRLYDEFYRFLASCGVDSVKTDVQYMLETAVDAAPRRDLVREYLDSWAIASLRHLGNRVISCMSHSPQILFYGLLPNNRSPVLFRNSADFMPEIESSHPWHLWTNAHNAVFSSHLNVIVDWDMFQTVHDYSAYHAAARCVSGSPIYVTDVPGEHNIGLIRQMTATSIRGGTVILRPSIAGKVSDPYIGYNDKKLLKVGSYHGGAGTGASFLGLFNVSAETVTELVPLSAFPSLAIGSLYIVRSHDGRITKPILATSANGGVPLLPERLGVRGWNILTACPVLSFVEQGRAGGSLFVANLGLIDKMTGAAAIISTSAKLVGRNNGRIMLETRLKALGMLGIYISILDKLSISNDFMITILNEPIPAHTVSKSGGGGVLRIDIETAWKEMGLESHWSNELTVRLHFSV